MVSQAATSTICTYSDINYAFKLGTSLLWMMWNSALISVFPSTFHKHFQVSSVHNATHSQSEEILLKYKNKKCVYPMLIYFLIELFFFLIESLIFKKRYQGKGFPQRVLSIYLERIFFWLKTKILQVGKTIYMQLHTQKVELTETLRFSFLPAMSLQSLLHHHYNFSFPFTLVA